MLSVLQTIYVTPRHKAPVTEVSRFAELHAELLHDDYDASVPLAQDAALEVQNSTAISPTEIATFASITQIQQRYNGVAFSLSRDSKTLVAEQLHAFYPLYL